MGLSASQARFLQLTARKSNVEYQAQQISFQRLQLSNKLESASMEYNEKISNKKFVYKYNSGTGEQKVDLTYQNYKNYMNQQMEGLSTAQDKLYLVSSSGNKIIVASEEEMIAMIDAYNSSIASSNDENVSIIPATDEDDAQATDNIQEGVSAGVSNKKTERKLTEKDFMIVEDVNDADKFNKYIEEGVFLFAKLVENPDTGQKEFEAHSWESLGNGVISEEYDKSDDAAAEAKYDKVRNETQRLDKALEMELDKLETERNAIQTEMDSISKVIDDNIEKTFKIFG